MKILCDRDPISGEDLASQPTLSRLENSVTGTQLMLMAESLAEIVLRECLLKIAVVVRESTRRIVANFTAHHPWADIWLRCATNLGAASG